MFNRLTRSRDALVADVPGLTRDRIYGTGRIGDKPYIVVDTGGLEPEASHEVYVEMAKQTQTAIAEADAIIFLVDAREGLTPGDRRIAEQLRKAGRRVVVAVNKAEGMQEGLAAAEFHELGLGSPRAISAAHGEGITGLIEAALSDFRSEPEEEAPDGAPRIAIVGRPNVGKSTLVNALVGEERMIALDEPGTTRDAVDVPVEIGGRRYTLVDTAGLRRRGKVFESIEKFSVVKTLQAIDLANVVVLVLDASQDIAEQDAHIAGFIAERGRALVVAVNKWDGLDSYARDMVKRAIARKLRFLAFARFHYISALKNEGIGALFASVDRAYRSAMAKMPTPKLTRALIAAVAKQAPRRAGYSRPKPRYAHQGGSNPPTIVVHGTALDSVAPAYRRYLESEFRSVFKLEGTPLRIEFRTARNPYARKRV